MYCPNCGFNNQADIKFCTRCGTNLSAVSEALSGLPGQRKPDDRMIDALKDYYLSRRSTLIGGLTLPIGLALLIAWSVIGFPQTFAVLALLGLALSIYGMIYTCWGIEHWIGSSSELKALRNVHPQISPAQPMEAIADASPRAPVEQYSTDPIEPASVTEHTTRQLEGSAHQTSLEIQSQ